MSDRRHFQKARRGLRCRRCLMRRAVHSHHVTYEAELLRRGLPKYDQANMMALCLDCHFNHHNGSQKIPLAMLSDENLEYAFSVLGAHAFDWLVRRYAGEDPRLDEQLRRSDGRAA